VPRRAIGRRGRDQALKWLSSKQAALRLAQIGVRGISPDPEVDKLANWPGRFEALQAQRSSDAGRDLRPIDHNVILPSTPALTAFATWCTHDTSLPFLSGPHFTSWLKWSAISGLVGVPPNAEAPDVQELQAMELAGLEPATSWVRCKLTKSGKLL
jgi:hypothetical protein